MRLLSLAAALIAMLALAGFAAAQDSGRPGPPGGSGDSGGRGMRRMTPPDPVVIHGPPAPQEFARIVELPDDHVDRYAQMYERFMASTRPQRDSLEALRQGMREAFENRDRSSAERQRTLAGALAQDLGRRQAAFDDALRDLLEKGQWKRYEQWRDDERERASEGRRDRRHGHPGGGPPA